MLDAMPTRLFMQWRAYCAEAPAGFEIQNLLFGNIARWVAVAGGSKRTRIDEYMLHFRKATQQSTSEIMAIARSMAAVVLTKDEIDGGTGSS